MPTCPSCGHSSQNPYADMFPNANIGGTTTCPKCGASYAFSESSSGRRRSSTESCVAIGTKIILPDGQYKLIEHIRSEEMVLGYHDVNKQFIAAKVTKVAVHPPSQVVECSTANGSFIATPRHPVFSNGKWCRIKNLKPGDSLSFHAPSSVHNHLTAIQSIKTLSLPCHVYNLYVDNACSYIANGFIANSYVVFPAIRAKINRLLGSIGSSVLEETVNSSVQTELNPIS